jgi:hypothetical protein
MSQERHETRKTPETYDREACLAFCIAACQPSFHPVISEFDTHFEATVFGEELTPHQGDGGFEIQGMDDFLAAQKTALIAEAKAWKLTDEALESMERSIAAERLAVREDVRARAAAANLIGVIPVSELQSRVAAKIFPEYERKSPYQWDVYAGKQTGERLMVFWPEDER